MKKVLITGGSGFIGTNLVNRFLHRPETAVLSIDIKPAVHPGHADTYRHIDIRDREELTEAFCSFQPDVVVHLAARTDLDGASLDEYRANTAGVENVIDAVSAAGSVKRCIFCSSKLVCKNGYCPRDDQDYCPDTLYGESKVLGEKIVRNSTKLKCEWCLVRPTSIWGPWLGIPYRGFFQAVARKRYFHPGSIDPPKGFGYVGNVIHQIVTLLDAPAEQIVGKTFYLSDYQEYTIRQWADTISMKLHGTRVRAIPTPVVRAAAVCGDLAKAFGMKNPPLTSFRLRNMWQDTAAIPLDSMKEISGPLPYTMEQGVDETVDWMKRRNLIG
jgi:nucleoside-diphosphate-sugar epimerase